MTLILFQDVVRGRAHAPTLAPVEIRSLAGQRALDPLLPDVELLP
jgi:hypothetical protein